jgi:hypothetical protein
VSGRPVDRANNLVRLSTSALLITSPFTTATIRTAWLAGAGAGVTAHAATGGVISSASAQQADAILAMTQLS